MKVVLTTCRGYVNGFFFIDDEDADLVLSRAWGLNSDGYAFSRINGRNQSAHRLVMGAGHGGNQIDHIDGNIWNNCKDNLRFASGSQNTANRHVIRSSSGYRGVTFHRRARKWQAAIKVMGKNKHLGLHETREAAALAYDRAAREIFGEFAIPNFSEAA
jgi:hypothetical protein